MFNYIKLYRIDVFIVTAINGICGYYFTEGELRLEAIYFTLFISGILYNYVYVLNALTDITADKINKPDRPLPSGKISYRAAIIYLAFLIIISIIGILVLFKGFNMSMAFLVLIIGGIYSVPPIELKSIPILAPFVTGWGVVHPIFITGDIKIILLPAIILTFYATGTTLLKDLSDIEGDKREGRKVVTNFISFKNLMKISMLMTFVAALLCLKLDNPIIGFAPLSTFFTTLYFYIFKNKEEIEKKFILK